MDLSSSVPCRPPVVVVMGVSGAGKSVVGAALAKAIGCPFCEGDALHPPANVERMARGEALGDPERAPWLDRVAAWIQRRTAGGAGGVVACSALRRRYRDRLRSDVAPSPVFVVLDPDRRTLERRLAQRRGHFMPASLLASQIDAFEPLQQDETGIQVPIHPDQTPPELVRIVRDWLDRRTA